MQTDPFEYTIVPAFLTAESIRRINATYHSITNGGSYLIEALEAGMAIKEVMNELDGREFEATVAEKFSLDLAGKPKMYSLRGFLRAKDGKIRTDSKDKIITAQEALPGAEVRRVEVVGPTVGARSRALVMAACCSALLPRISWAPDRS